MRHALRAACAAGLIAASLAAASPTAANPAPAPDPVALCRQAILTAEREWAVPPALLHAIARVESGRADPRTGAVNPWPWTINAEGQGRWYATKQEAILAAEALQARGIRVIDVGCMQVNLHHHPQAFANLEEAFDPLANARYAGVFLTRLFQQRRSWEQAAASYHSSTPELGEAYRLKVMAAWPAMAGRMAEERRREGMVAVWNAERPASARPAPGTASANGFQRLALDLAQRPASGPANGPARLRGLLDLSVPPSRTTIRGPGGRSVQLVELAEVPFRR